MADGLIMDYYTSVLSSMSGSESGEMSPCDAGIAVY
jgi:hypothetical protein